jgi:hypothetical protein
MRLVGAGLFVFSGVLLTVALVGSQKAFDRAPSWLIGSGISLVMLALMVLSLWLFNARGSNPFGRMTEHEHLQELERLGLLESTAFRATRAFGVEEFEDEGLHFFLELTDGRVLFLSGQYLYDYEPNPDIGTTQRLFPCTEFTVRRHKKEGYTAEIVCGGTVLEPEVMAPSLGKKVWQRNRIPEDGRVITDITYDRLKQQLSGGSGGAV